MKNRKIKEAVLCLACMLFLTGCGTKAYLLTDSEEDIIVNYAAHVVSKYNACQKDGLVYVNQELETTETEEIVPEDAEPDDNTLEISDGTTVSGENEEETVTSSLNDVFGSDGLELSYTGVELAADYKEGESRDAWASEGKQFMILSIEISNPTEAELSLDNLTTRVKFSADYSPDGAESTSVSAYTTIMLNDFSTYAETIPAGETKQAVLLFQIPDSVTEVSDLVLHITSENTDYQIKL